MDTRKVDLQQPLLVAQEVQNGLGSAKKLEPSAPSHSPLPVPRSDSPYSRASWLSRLTFWWLGDLLRLGYSRSLELVDIPELDPVDKAEKLHADFSRAWDAEVRHGPDPIFRVLRSCFWRLAIFTGLLAFVRALCMASAPLFLSAFLKYAASSEAALSHREGYVIIIGLSLTKVVESFTQRHWLFGARRLGLRLRSAVTEAVFEKELRLSSAGRRDHSAGEIVNYISVDAYRLGEFPWYMHYLWVAPFQIVLAFAVLFYTVGLASVPAMATIALLIAISIPFAQTIQSAQQKLMVAQDERLRTTTEVLNNMKVVKLQAWEEKMRAALQDIREDEVKWLRIANRKRAFVTLLFWISPILVGSVIFVCCIWLNKPLDAVTVFTVLASFRIIQEPIRMVPEMLASFIQVRVSLKRLGKFLGEDELKKDAVSHTCSSSEFVIQVDNCCLTWDPDSLTPTLKGITVNVKPKEKVAVCGTVGSGKSSLLYALLGEMPKLSGSVQCSGTTAYVTQSAWIQSGTVRDNILFNKPMDKTRYQNALKACSLEKDLESFPFGDLTEIGERGLNMSGGQKQRIQLARAVYSDADIYLLDDPFSAVDAHTATALFKDCVMGALAEKTVILVTHQVEFLPAVDCILVMQEGRIKQTGRYNELLMAGENFEQLVNAHQETLKSVDFDEISQESNQTTSLKRKFSRKESSQGELVGTTNQLVQQEEKEVGNMGLKPYIQYISVSGGAWVFTFLIAAQTIFVVFQILSNFWLAQGVTSTDISSGLLVIVFLVLSVISAVFVHLRSEFTVLLGLKASVSFFYKMNNSIFRAPMSFFDSTPTGRILNRASTDLSVLDIDIPFSFGLVTSGLLELGGVLVVISIVTWIIVIVAIPTIILVQWIQRYYVASAQELRRINAMTKAPIVNFSGEAVHGAATIRAFQMVDTFRRKNLQLIDSDATLYFHNSAAMEWLIQRLDILSNVVLCATGILLVVFPSNAGYAGLALAYALTLSAQQVFFVQWQCNFVNFIVSVERILQYTQLPSEAPAIIEDSRPPQMWPNRGNITLEKLKIRYRRDSPLVLRNITCTFEGGHRIGVVGRTGSGKTTLISALFRLVEPAGGKITIDGIDICSIGLHDLRSRLGIIPQEPTLFRGTVRTNLDPLGQYSDQKIWEAIDRCQLGNEIRASQFQLDSPVRDDGENWSAGQRQLFCLGRVLLKESRILVLDEATASVDSQTDAILQRVIREDFVGSTVITVAHRIPTVVDSDRILGLQDGKLIEYDSPNRLLQNEESLFAKLVAEYWAQVSSGS